jgi:hypothetical protein
MSDANNEQLLPPASWDKFEEICADLFSRIWGDTQLARYGRTGQRQNGVDIYGKEKGADSGVQRKGTRNWPPTKFCLRRDRGGTSSPGRRPFRMDASGSNSWSARRMRQSVLFTVSSSLPDKQPRRIKIFPAS